MMQRSKSFGPTSVTAETKTQVGSDYTMPSGARRIIGMQVCVGTLAKAEGITGHITLEHDGATGPFEYAIPLAMASGTSGTETAWGALCGIAIIPVDISGINGGVLKVYATMIAAVEVTVSVLFE